MKITPEYTENIIVAIVQNKKLFWYIGDKEIWYMAYAKRIRQFEDKGYKINLEYIDITRKNLLLLDTDNIDLFRKSILEYEVKTKELRKYLEKEVVLNEEWYYDLSPSLYIDFIRKCCILLIEK